MSITASIHNHISASDCPVSVTELYKVINAKRHSIRAKLHYATAKGTVNRVAKGLYVCAGQQVGTVADARLAVKELADAGAKFDFVVLDLPYHSGGTKGGNRLLSNFAVITPAEFGDICKEVRRLLRTDESPALFIFSTGKSGAKARAAYQAQIDKHLKAAAFGNYTKTYKDGKPVAFGKYTIPTEGLWAYTRSGKTFDAINLEISAVRPNGGYPTRKPVAMLEAVIAQVVPSGGLVLDCFGGSGSTAAACESLGVSSLSFDIAHNPITYWKSHYQN